MMCFNFVMPKVWKTTLSFNLILQFTQYKHFSSSLRLTWENIMPQINKIRLDLRKRITDAHKAGNGFTKLSQRSK